MSCPYKSNRHGRGRRMPSLPSQVKTQQHRRGTSWWVQPTTSNKSSETRQGDVAGEACHLKNNPRHRRGTSYIQPTITGTQSLKEWSGDVYYLRTESGKHSETQQEDAAFSVCQVKQKKVFKSIRGARSSRIRPSVRQALRGTAGRCWCV